MEEFTELLLKIEETNQLCTNKAPKLSKFNKTYKENPRFENMDLEIM